MNVDQEPLLPRPVIDTDNERYWSACRDQELRVQRCLSCGAYRFPPRPMCPCCHSFEHAWPEVSGRGRIYSWIVVCHPVHPAAAGRVPYVLGLVELEEGPRIVTELVDCAGRLEPGLPVVVGWRTEADGLSLPVFSPQQ